MRVVNTFTVSWLERERVIFEYLRDVITTFCAQAMQIIWGFN